MKVIIAGDSHGEFMVGIMEGMPAGIKVDIRKVDAMLSRRQGGFGRGMRMNIEDDHAEAVAGIWKGFTTGAPIAMRIKNRGRQNPVENIRSIPRPGHADYAAWSRYKLPDLNIYAERSSARWTAAFTALGALAKQFLEKMKITVYSYVFSIGSIKADDIPCESETLLARRDASLVYCPDNTASEQMYVEIESAIEEGNSLGGSFKVVAEGIPAGLGGYSDIFAKIDSRIGAYFMAIPAIKGVFIGNEQIDLPGSSYHDPFEIQETHIRRKSNNAGGLEGGMTNGEPVIVTAYVKPIPTLKKGLKSVDLDRMMPATTPYVRSDVTIVPAASVIGESALALVLLEAFLERYGNDNYEDIRRRYNDENIPRWNDGFWKDNDR
ncbi:MAG: chorismate synthase [Thermotoga sp.]|nr:MAG: chorismate synthase [Thermotoga sp.]